MIPHAELIIRKGFRKAIDSYSAFFENDHQTPTGLGGYLRARGLTRSRLSASPLIIACATRPKMLRRSASMWK